MASSQLPADLVAIIDRLCAAAIGDVVTLDAIGDAVGLRAIDTSEIEAILDALEARGVAVQVTPGGDGPALLKQVIPAARALLKETSSTPSVEAIATRTGLAVERVRHALFLAKIIGRGPSEKPGGQQSRGPR